MSDLLSVIRAEEEYNASVQKLTQVANGNEELRETLRTASERVSSALNEQQQLIERQANAQVDLEATQVRRDCVLRQLARLEASRRATCEHESVLERENQSTTHRLKVTFEAQKAHEATWEVDAVHEKATELVMLQLENESLTKQYSSVTRLQSQLSALKQRHEQLQKECSESRARLDHYRGRQKSLYGELRRLQHGYK